MEKNLISRKIKFRVMVKSNTQQVRLNYIAIGY